MFLFSNCVESQASPAVSTRFGCQKIYTTIVDVCGILQGLCSPQLRSPHVPRHPAVPEPLAAAYVDELHAYVAEHLGDPGGVVVVDETGFSKKGTYSAGSSAG